MFFAALWRLPIFSYFYVTFLVSEEMLNIDAQYVKRLDNNNNNNESVRKASPNVLIKIDLS